MINKTLNFRYRQFKKKLNQFKRRSTKKKKRNLRLKYHNRCKNPDFISDMAECKMKKHEIELPENFSLSNNTDGIIVFTNEIYELAKKKCFIKFDMTKIVSIDIEAIVLFLTVLSQLTQNNIRYKGNSPLNQYCKKIFEDSGFLEHMKIIGKKSYLKKDTGCLIVKQGGNKVDGEITGVAIKKAIAKITGAERNYRPVQTVVLEMIGNAIEHAYNEKKHWLFCINVENGIIKFIVSDAGEGIIKTINKKFIDTLKDNFTNSITILSKAFNGEYISKTKEKTRGKGLLKIRSHYEEGKIKRLKVLTNNVFQDFDNIKNSQVLKNNYNGTMYMCEIDKDNLE